MKLQPLTLLACLSLPLAGCILVADNDDDMDDAGLLTEGEPEPETDGASESASSESDGDTDADPDGGTDGETDGDTEGDSGGDGLECSANILSDPSFEAGTPNEMWEEASELFGTPLCDETCTTDDGAVPYDGQWWIWFGGMDDQESASMMQSATFDAEHAILSFQFSINSSAGTGDDVFSVKVDDDTVFMATDADWESYDGYTLVEVDVSAYADGEAHEITLAAETAGGGLTNFFVDDVSLTECESTQSDDESGSGDETGGDTDDSDTDGDTDASDTDASDTDGDTDASDTDAESGE